MATKKIKDFETERGVIITSLSDKEVERLVTEDEFNEIMETAENAAQSCRYNPEDRLKFLRDNGYKITRANIADSSLSHKA